MKQNQAAETCEFCGRSASSSGYRYTHAGAQLSEKATFGMKRCWSCRKRGCDRCLVLVEETADDHFIEICSCSRCLGMLNS